MDIKDNERLIEDFKERHKRMRGCIDEWGKSIDNPQRQKELLAEIGRLQQVDLKILEVLSKEVDTLGTRLDELIKERS